MNADRTEWADAARDMPRQTRRDLLRERADLCADDLLPPAAHLMPAPGIDVLAVFAAECRAARWSA